MTTFNEREHPRASDGQFTNKQGTAPEVGVLTVTEYTAEQLAGMTYTERLAAAQQNFDAARATGLSAADAAHTASNAAIYPAESKERHEYGMSRLMYQNDVRAVFSDALADENGMDDLTPAQRKTLFERAWETGHSSGWNSVESEYEDLAIFVREMQTGA